MAVLILGGPIAPRDIPAICERAGALLEDSHAELIVCDVGEVVDPDAMTVEALARVGLTVGRLGCRVELRDPRPELRELLDFMGLAEVLR